MREASGSFKDRTIAADGRPPRHFRLLPIEILLNLCKLLMTFERIGFLPAHNSGVLIGTMGARRRPIGWFRSCQRLYLRVRSQVVRRWEATHANLPIFNWGAGTARRLGDSVWRGIARADLATSSKHHSVEILWDFMKLYEHMDYSVLVHNATADSYPLRLLRMSVLLYQQERKIIGGHLCYGCVRTKTGELLQGQPLQL